jgi:hypothetical protein
MHDWIAAQCAPMPGERLAVNSIAEMQTTIRRRWAACSSPGLFDSSQEQGIEIGADDRYAFLAWSGDTLVRQTGLENEGSVTYDDIGTYAGWRTIQVDFNSDAETFLPTDPVLSDNPRFMLLGDLAAVKYLALQ